MAHRGPEAGTPAGGVFVGRERERAELGGIIDSFLLGQGALALVTGPPGIGKTRLVDETSREAADRGALVLWGRAWEGEGAPAYWPWIQVLRSYARSCSGEALVQQLGRGAPLIAQMVPELEGSIPEDPEAPEENLDRSRFNLFDAMCSFLREAARTQPIVLVQDDLHWADRSSLLLLEFIARDIGDVPLLALGTYRDLEARIDRQRADVLGSIGRLGRRLPLGGWTREETNAFVGHVFGAPITDRVLSEVYEVTEGNPFFVDEVVRLLVAEGRSEDPGAARSRLPEGVRETMLRHLEPLPERTRELLTLASVMGREFGLNALQEASGDRPEQLLEALSQAVDAGIVVESELGRYAFTHALIRETLYDELTTRERMSLHHRVGEAIERLHGGQPDTHLTELAHHYFQAAPYGPTDKAVEYAARAGARALLLLAYDEAAQHFQRALQALEVGEMDEERRCHLLLNLGEAELRRADLPRARQAFEQAAAIARRLGFHEEFARAALGYGGVWAQVGIRDDTLIGLLEDALDMVGDAHSQLRTRVTARLAAALYWSDEHERRALLAHESVGAARASGDRTTLAYVLHRAHWALWGPDNLDERLDMAREIVRLARDTGNRELELEGRVWLLTDLLELGEMRDVDAEIEAHARLAREMRQPYHLRYVHQFRAMRAAMQGRFEESEREAQDALTIGQQEGDPNAVTFFGVQLLAVRWEQGRMAELIPVVESTVGRLGAVTASRTALAFTYAQGGRLDDARVELSRLTASGLAGIRKDATWIPVLAMLSEVAADLGDAAMSESLYACLEPYRERANAVGHGLACYGALTRYLARLAETAGRTEEADDLYRDALARNDLMQAIPAGARTRLGYARFLRATGRSDEEVRALAEQALATATRIGMDGVARSAHELLAGLRPVADATVPSAPAAGREGTVTILFTDVEASTELTERIGDRRSQQVLGAHNRLVRAQMTAHRGEAVQSRGDGFMAAFQSAGRALECAVAIQEAVAAYSKAHPDTPLAVRIGLHTGEPLREGEDFYGRAVHLAARIAGQAAGGEILVSGLVRELVSASDDLRFGDAKSVELRGLAGVHTVHSVEWRR